MRSIVLITICVILSSTVFPCKRAKSNQYPKGESESGRLDWRKPREAEQLLVSEKKVADNDVSLVTRLLGSYAYGNHSGYTSNEKAKIDAVYFAGPFV